MCTVMAILLPEERWGVAQGGEGAYKMDGSREH